MGNIVTLTYGAIGTGLCLLLALSVIWDYRHARLARMHRRFLCYACLYPLHGLAESGSCPECREPYRREDLWKKWRNWEDHSRQTKHWAMRHRFKICRACLSPLAADHRQVPESGTCPVCHAAFARDETVTYWQSRCPSE